MALTPIPYQALPFDVQENCTVFCAPWIQKIAEADRTSFQFRFNACANSRSVLTNGNFTDGGTGWMASRDWNFTGYNAIAPIATSGFIQQTVTGAVGLYYQLDFLAEIWNGTLVVSTNLGLVAYYSTSGAYTLTINSAGVTSIGFFFDSPLGGVLQTIRLTPINTRVQFKVADLAGNVVASIGSASMSFTRGFLTVNPVWNSLALPDGCYKIQAFDPCECSQFGFMGDDFTFPNQFDVTVGGESNVNIGGGNMQVLNSGVTQVVVQKKSAACVGVEYAITYTLAGMVGSDTFRIAIGSANGIIRTADGTYTENRTVTASNDDLQHIRFIFGVPGGLHLVTLSAFSFVAVTPVVSSESVPFELKETHGCTTALSWCGNTDQLGFGFGDTGFHPIVRLEGMYRGSGYPSTRESYRRATGRHNVYYGNQQKERMLSFSAPEYVQDFASKVIVASNVYINGAAVFCTADDSPTPSYEDDFDLGHVQYPFVPLQELIENRACGTVTETGCSLRGIPLTITGTGGIKFPSRIPLAVANGTATLLIG